MLDVDHYVRVIQQHPATRGPSLATDRTEVLLDEFLFDPVNDGVDLAFAGGGRDQEDVGQGKPFADVEGHDVLGNLVRRSPRCVSGCGDG